MGQAQKAAYLALHVSAGVSTRAPLIGVSLGLLTACSEPQWADVRRPRPTTPSTPPTKPVRCRLHAGATCDIQLQGSSTAHLDALVIQKRLLACSW